MSQPQQELRIDEQMPLPARRLLNVVQRLLKCSPQAARRAVIDGRVSVNRRATQTPDSVLRVGDMVSVLPPPSFASQRNPTDETWNIVFEDELIVVVNKPAGLLTVPSPYGEKRTMISLVTRKLQESNEAAAAFSVHRLDRDVSGLLVFAKSLELAKRLRDQFAERKPERHYTAIVIGVPRDNHGTLRSYLATDDQLNRYSVESADQGQLAITHYRVVKSFADAAQLDVTLETGRRNQIRVHLAELGHPIIGETRYRRQQAAHRAWPFRRLALHAAQLAFDHPVSGQRLQFSSELPGPFHHFFRQQSRDQRHQSR
ncbi:MAG TPA: RluA family pseudouridine synthase [Pirellulaceae bacterium]|mgnify:CR=1 FL=1|nr:RluA family pseudouridine synthase [Pirellulaceae bacterium]